MDKELLERLLAGVVASNASTLYLSAGSRPSVRDESGLRHVGEAALTAKDLSGLCVELLFRDHHLRIEQGGEVEVFYATADGARFRATFGRQSAGESAVFRRIPTEVPTLESLHVPSVVGGFAELQSGLVLLTGFRGSGKSSTIAAMVDHINRNQSRHIVTLEERVPFIHRTHRAVVHQRQVGSHVGSYAEGIVQAGRAGVDVLVVGSIRDHETLDAILEATERGVLVIAATHAGSTVGAMTELQALYPPDDRARLRARISHALRVLFSQALIPNADESSRVPVVEILVNKGLVKKVIHAGAYKDLPEAIDRTRSLGSQSFDLCLRNLVREKLITERQAALRARDRSGFKLERRIGRPLSPRM